MSTRCWSIAGAAAIEIAATLATAGVHLRMPGLEEAVLKVNGQLRVLKSQPPLGFSGAEVNFRAGVSCKLGSQRKESLVSARFLQWENFFAMLRFYSREFRLNYCDDHDRGDGGELFEIVGKGQG